MKKVIVFAIALLASAAVISAKAPFAMSLNLGDQYTYTEIVSNLGNPNSTNGEAWHAYQDLAYEGFQLCFEDGELWQYVVTSPEYAMFTDCIKGGIRVGDNISKVHRIRNAHAKRGAKENTIVLFSNDDWRKAEVCYDTQSGKITKIREYMAF